MKYPVKYILFLLVILLLACLTRILRLEDRPMHHDEAINAYKLGILLETGDYLYDKNEYHGPVFYYSSMILARISGKTDLRSLNESTLRATTAFYGITMMLLLILLADSLGWITILVSTLMFVFAPALLFYNRYFIHESLLVFFSFAAMVMGYKYLLTRKLVWIILFGASIGFMHATKETFILNLTALIMSGLILYFLMKRKTRSWSDMGSFPRWHLLAMLAMAIVVSVTLFSSFFNNPQGILDSISTYTVYLNRASFDDTHLHPWYYYIKLLVSNSNESTFFWGDLWMLVLAITGFVLVIFQKRKKPGEYFLLFAGLYSFLLLFVYSFISYKTPWNILQFYCGLLLLAAYGLTRIIRIRTFFWLRTAMIVLILAGGFHWMYDSYRLNFQEYTAPENPYVYAHTSEDIFYLTELVSRISQVHPEGSEMPVEIIIPGNEYWPLPWYLRKFRNTAWWDHVSIDQPAAPLIIAAASVEKELIKKLYLLPPPGKRYLYITVNFRYMELRFGQEIRVYLRKDIWDLFEGHSDDP